MRLLSVLSVGGPAALLAVAWWMPYQASDPADARLASRTPATGPAGASPPSGDQARGAGAGDNRDAQVLVDRILARPLFNADRRPATGSSIPGSTAMPRLTAVLVSRQRKAAIFAGGADGKPVVLLEGGRIGEYVVRSIDAGQVTVSGPGGGTQLVRPTPEESGQAAVPGAAAQPSLLDMLRQRATTADGAGLPGLVPR